MKNDKSIYEMVGLFKMTKTDSVISIGKQDGYTMINSNLIDGTSSRKEKTNE